VTRIADAFTWPFRASVSVWLIGIIAVLLWPVLFVPLVGYAIAATRSGESAPPRWVLSWRLVTDGFWTSLAIVTTLVPFTVVFFAVPRTIGGVGLAIVFFGLLLLWGLFALLLLPHATVAFATSGRPRELFDLSASLRRVRRDFPTWNVVVAAIVTGWAIGLACAGLFCVGLVPGVFYAILVSAHATAALADSNSSAR
jgi:hypothetical protein